MILPWQGIWVSTPLYLPNHRFMSSNFNCILYGGGLVAKLCLTLVTPWSVACRVPLSMGFSRPEYWSGWPFPFQGIFPTQGSNPGLLHGQQILSRLSHQGSSDFQRSPVLLVTLDPSPAQPPSGFPERKKESEVAQLCLTLQPHGL